MSNFIKLFLSAGLPKIPYVGLPFVCILILLDLRVSLRLIRKNTIFQYYIMIVIMFTISIFYLLFSGGSSKEVIFLFGIFIKFLVGPHIAYYIYQAHVQGYIGLYIVLQFIILLMAVSSPIIYDFLLKFQSSGAADLFGGIKDKRSLAFGLLHNEGAMFIAVMFYLSFVKGVGMTKAYGLLSIAFLMMSRLTGVLIFVILILRRPFSLVLVAMLLTFIVWNYHEVFPSILNEALEPLVYLFSNKVFYSATWQHMIWMLVWPAEISTWIFGDGRFFEPSGSFYMGTDLGFLRIIYFSGCIGFGIFVLLHLWPVINDIRLNVEELILFSLFLLGIFKGLNPHPWIFFLMYFLRKQP